MARTFTKNTANYASLGAGGMRTSLEGAGAIAISCRAYMISATTGITDNSILHFLINSTTVGIELNIDGSSSLNRVRLNGRSVSTDSRQGRTGTSTVPLNTWFQMGGLFDIANDVIDPVYNGVVENGGAVTFANTTFTYGTPSGNDNIGAYNLPGTGATIEQWDGYIAELAIWTNWRPSSRQWRSLTAFAPWKVNRGNMKNYFIRHADSGAAFVDVIGGVPVTIGGSIPRTADHPRVIL